MYMKLETCWKWQLRKSIDFVTRVESYTMKMIVFVWNEVIKEDQHSEAATQRCSLEKVFWKYAANLQENTHAEGWFQ